MSLVSNAGEIALCKSGMWKVSNDAITTELFFTTGP
jgi:hypothetical protein